MHTLEAPSLPSVKEIGADIKASGTHPPFLKKNVYL